jgi:hypothetical protein
MSSSSMVSIYSQNMPWTRKMVVSSPPLPWGNCSPACRLLMMPAGAGAVGRGVREAALESCACPVRGTWRGPKPRHRRAKTRESMVENQSWCRFTICRARATTHPFQAPASLTLAASWSVQRGQGPYTSAKASYVLVYT